jgi:hypothetical protein
MTNRTALRLGRNDTAGGDLPGEAALGRVPDRLLWEADIAGRGHKVSLFGRQSAFPNEEGGQVQCHRSAGQQNAWTGKLSRLILQLADQSFCSHARPSREAPRGVKLESLSMGTKSPLISIS